MFPADEELCSLEEGEQGSSEIILRICLFNFCSYSIFVLKTETDVYQEVTRWSTVLQGGWDC